MAKELVTEKPADKKPASASEKTEKPATLQVEKSVTPLGQREGGSRYNIKAHLNPEVEKVEEAPQTEDKSKLPRNHFSDTDLQREWGLFLKEIEARDFIVYGAICTFKVVKKDEETIVLHYPSDSAKAVFDKIHGEFLNHFKRVVNNYIVTAEYVRDAALKKEVLTKRKIFEKMAEINPLLNKLDDLMRFDFSS